MGHEVGAVPKGNGMGMAQTFGGIVRASKISMSGAKISTTAFAGGLVR